MTHFNTHTDERNWQRYSLSFEELEPQRDQLVCIFNIQNLEPQTEGKISIITSNNWRNVSIEELMDMKIDLQIHSLQIGDFNPKDLMELCSKYLPLFEKLYLSLLNDFSHPNKLEIKTIFEGIFLRLTQLEPSINREGSRVITNENAEDYQEKVALFERYNKVFEMIIRLWNQNYRYELEKYNIAEDSKYLNDANIVEIQELVNRTEKCKTYQIKQKLLTILCMQITDENNRVKPEYIPLLEELAKKNMPIPLGKFDLRYTLPSNAKGLTIDIGKARSRKISIYELANGLRVGNISNNDNVLEIHEIGKRQTIYVKGEKHLKQRIRMTKGKLKKFDNLLTIGQGTIYYDLMEIETINALAALNPEKVMNIAENYKIKGNSLEMLAKKARFNYKTARQLADTVVEKAYHIDPIAAKKLINQFKV